MNQMKPSLIARPVKTQRGVGLTEVLVAMAIGLVLLGAVALFFLGSMRINSTHDDVSRMQESGRNALEIMGRAIRQAGFRLDVSQAMDGDAIAFSNGTGAGATALPDTITIRHDPTAVVDADNPLNGQEANCAGDQISSNNDSLNAVSDRAVNSSLVESRFAVADLALTCRPRKPDGTVASAAVILVNNIENMQITYGVSDVSGAIISYKAAPTAAELELVSAVHVSLLVRGPSPNIAANKSQTYTYNGQTVTATDGYLRQVYSTTFNMRNIAN